jgi:collagenase-like PrtC family protease
MNIIVSLNDIENLVSAARFPISHLLIGDGHFSSDPLAKKRDQISRFIAEAHKLSLKVIIRVDRLYEEHELEALRDYLRFLNAERADGLLISDLAVAMLAEEEGLNLACLYAPETLLTNSSDVRQLLQSGMKGCVISKDIPLSAMKQIALNNPEGCWLRVYGPQLIAYSRRRFVELYLQDGREHPKNYFLQEESRPQKLPIIEKSTGSWLYGPCLQSLTEIKDIMTWPLHGIIFDGAFSADREVLQALRLHLEVLQGQLSAEEAAGQLPAQQAGYQALSAIRRTVMDKEDLA